MQALREREQWLVVQREKLKRGRWVSVEVLLLSMALMDSPGTMSFMTNWDVAYRTLNSSTVMGKKAACTC